MNFSLERNCCSSNCCIIYIIQLYIVLQSYDKSVHFWHVIIFIINTHVISATQPCYSTKSNKQVIRIATKYYRHALILVECCSKHWPSCKGCLGWFNVAINIFGTRIFVCWGTCLPSGINVKSLSAYTRSVSFHWVIA